MKRKLGLIIICLAQIIAYSQTSNQTPNNTLSGENISKPPRTGYGIIEGLIKDVTSGEALIGAYVYVLENNKVVAISNTDGSYSLKIPEGSYTLVCSYISYEELHIPRFTVESGKTKQMNLQLATSAISINQVTVMARTNTENELVTLTQQKKATVMETSMGANELSRKGASDVAAGVKKMSGISMIGNSQLFVRGLGDRYNLAQINGMILPSPDPSKKIIALHLFPSDVIKSIGVTKVFSTQNYSDYSGALINIETKEYPEKRFLTIGGGISYNSNSTYKKFLQSNSNTNGYFGLDAIQRNSILPDEYKIVNRNQSSLGESKDIFSSNFGYTSFKAIPGISANIATGNTYKINTSKIGILFSSSFDNDFETRENVYDAELKADGTLKNFFYKDTYTYSTRFTNLLNVSHLSESGSYIKANFFYTTGTEDIIEIKDDGISNEGDSLYVQNSEFTNNSLYYGQLLGKKTITKYLDIDWNLGYSNALSSNPDRKQITYIRNNNEWNIYALNLQESLRAFINQSETMYSGEVQGNFKIEKYKTNLSIGSQMNYKMKDYKSYVYYYNVSGVSDISSDPTNPLHIFSTENFETNSIYIKNGNSYPLMYLGNASVISGFADITNNSFAKTTINTGLRYEYSTMNVIGYNQAGIEQTHSIIAHDFFPAINIKHVISDNSNIRFAGSKTITRPSFYEKSPAIMIPKFGEPKTEGNKDLQNAYNTNFDAKFEKFPKKGEIISLGVYGKILENPIEMVAKPTGGSILYTFKNTEKGYASGIELEYKKLFTENLFFGCNASYIYTYIQVSETANETEKKRSMQGASPYLINGDIGYQISYGEQNSKMSSIALVYNVYGNRLYAVGTDGMGSVFEMPFHSLDIILKNKIHKNWNANVSVKNILNPRAQFKQGVNYNESTNSYSRFEKLTEYKKGVSASLSISYSIN